MNNEKNKNKKVCELCNTKATCLCFKCYNYFCERCYKIIYDIKNNPEHKKEIIDQYVPINVKCPIHPQDRTNLFCIDDKGKIKNIYYYYSRNMLCFMSF